MTNTPANDQWFQHRAEELIHQEQLKRVELLNGRAAMLGFGALVDGYAACRTQFLPFCF